MAITAKGLPYQQGQGEAYIFGQPDLSGMKRQTDAMERRANKLAEEKKAQEAKREKQINDILNKNYDLGAQRDVSVIGEKTKELRDYVTGQLQDGNRNVLKAGTPEWEQYKTLEDQIMNAGKNSVLENKWINDSISQIKGSSDKYLDKEKAIGELLDHYYGSDGKKNILSEDYGERPNWMEGAFNEGKWLGDFVDELPEMVNKSFSNVKHGEGTYIDVKEVKGKFFELDEKGNVLMENGKPVIKISEETSAMALQNPRFRRYVEAQLAKPENKGKSGHQIVADKLGVHGYANLSKDRKKGFATKKDSGQGKYSKEEIFARQEIVERTQKNIETQYNSLKGGKLPDGKTTITDVSYDESNSKLWFNGGKFSIDISEENNGGFEEIWNIYNTVPGFKKIDVTELIKNKDYKEQYYHTSDRVDYGEDGQLKADIEKMLDSPDDDNSQTHITSVLKSNPNVSSIEWDDEILIVKYLDNTVDRVEVPERKKNTPLDKKAYRNLQDLLIKNNKGKYLKTVEPGSIDYDNLDYGIDSNLN